MNEEKKKILFVDDDESICTLMRRTSERSGKFTVETALNGQKALDLVKTFRPDLIVLDLMLPDISGSTVAAELKEHPASENIPIIFLTGLAEGQNNGNGAQHAGGSWVMAKPVSPFDVVALIEKILFQTEAKE